MSRCGWTSLAPDGEGCVWEAAEPGPRGVTIRALLRPAGGVWPVRLDLRWGPHGAGILLGAPPPEVPELAVETLVGIPMDPHEDWSALSLTARWPDGAVTELPPAPALAAGLFRVSRLATAEEFATLCQNPAIRLPSPWLQAHGAARALRLAGDDEAMWLTAATVALYRCIEEGTFRRAEAEALLARWEGMRTALMEGATGFGLRCATSMHLAAAHAWLAWGDRARAREEFTAVTRYADRLDSWPAVLMNLGVASAAAALLALEADDRQGAAALVAQPGPLVARALAGFQATNWWVFDEVVGAMAAWQRCFAIGALLAGQDGPAVLPADAAVRLSGINATLAGLVRRGVVRDVVLLRR